MVSPSFTMPTMRLPLRWALRLRRESAAGTTAFCGSVMPRDSATQAMVEAVPMVEQWPLERLYSEVGEERHGTVHWCIRSRLSDGEDRGNHSKPSNSALFQYSQHSMSIVY